MRVVLYLSKNTDLVLYAYFRDLECRKSTHAKMLLKDYIHNRHTVYITPPRVTADTWQDISLPKTLTIPIRFGQEDKDLAEYFSDIPTGLRAKCMKSMLRVLISPYTQCAFHRDHVSVYAPGEKAAMPPMQDSTQALACTVQSMQLLMLQMMQSAQQGAGMAAASPPAPDPVTEKPEFLSHRPEWSAGGVQKNSDSPLSWSGGQSDQSKEISPPVVVGGGAGQGEIGTTQVLVSKTMQGAHTEDAGCSTEGTDDDAIMKLFGVDY